METLWIREIKCELGVLSRPDGSALFTIGNTVVMAAVYGPVEVRSQRLLIDKATVEVVYRPKAGLPSVADKIKESVLTKVFQAAILSTQHPRTSFNIIVQEMQECGGLLACSINAACLALMNAGVPMKFLVAAVCCMLDKENQIIFDPDIQQLRDSKAVFTIVFDGIDKNIIAMENSGTFTKDQFQSVLVTCQQASSHIFQFYRNIVEKYSKNISPS